MSHYYLSVKDKDGKNRHFEVPQEVYLYVQQLEAYIKNPDVSELKENYPSRFYPDRRDK